jgi:hypothetical protein
MLARAGASPAERDAALERVAAAELGEVVDLGYGLAIRHGETEGASLTLDGQRVGDEFPLAIAYHLLAFFVGELIYDSALDPVRAILRGEQPLGESEVVVESLIDRSTDYAARHVLGLSRVEPHLRIRVQLFGPPLWHVHLMNIKAPKLSPIGIALDLKELRVLPAAPARRTEG